MITKRDNQVVEYFSKYKYGTIGQIEKIFFREDSQQYSYNIARRRLCMLRDMGYLKQFRDIATNHNIYAFADNKVKAPGLHRIILLDFLAELYYQGCSIELFEVEKYWVDGKIRSDAVCAFTFSNRRYRFFIEVQLSNHDHGLEKYDELYKSGEAQKLFNSEKYPRVLLISDRHFGKVSIETTDVVQLNTKLEMFAKILL